MKLRYLGHAAFEVTDEDRILVDPFITGNPKAPCKSDELKYSIICVTHGHADHLGDTLSIAKKNNAVVVGVHELCQYLVKCASKSKPKFALRTEGINIGGGVKVGKMKITATPALHSGGIDAANRIICGGSPCGFIIENVKKVYHAGDTALFTDMKLIGENYKPDIALLPIGDRFTMNLHDAAIAASWLKAEVIIPMHYNTFPFIEVNPAEFVEVVDTLCESEVVMLNPGEVFEA